MSFTPTEINILTRIMGNHVTSGSGVIDALYEKLLRMNGGNDRGPYNATGAHPYGDRPMIDIDTNSFPTRKG